MRKWLEDVRAPKMYRYLFYTMVRWAKSWNNDSPNFSSMLFMTVTFGFQLLFLLNLIGVFIGVNFWYLFFREINPLFITPFMLVFNLVPSFVIFYYNNKFLQIEKEFINENEKQQRWGSIYLFIYLFISFSLFYGCMWLVTFNNPNY
ncbi:hypothetical protein [uncultured Maribacter sp.]|uniref:hypothetical protein n=1 Tax=uncultured Maribacter sp. TaxID=431308 RepID=UPI0026232FCF|nr:hypothetical protein [uncultured Maribacter sp.]